MQIQTVGILSPGDMGQAMSDDKPLRVYAAVLNRHGLKTIAALEERSHRSLSDIVTTLSQESLKSQ